MTPLSQGIAIPDKIQKAFDGDMPQIMAEHPWSQEAINTSYNEFWKMMMVEIVMNGKVRYISIQFFEIF